MTLLDTVRSIRDELRLPDAAKQERARDRRGENTDDPGLERCLESSMGWLARAQDCSTTRDGGVARHFSLIDGWGSSYPETTGYIVPTMLQYAHESGMPEFRERARRMLDWFVRIQLPGGGFQGGKIDSTPVVPVTFNTGQILIGLAAGVREGLAGYDTMRKAADWLAQSLDADGCWRRHATPFAEPGEKAYETHVSWGLFEAARVDPDRGWAEAAMTNIRWAMTKQRANGWVESCCLDEPAQPLTHTLGYYLRGLVEAHRFSNDAAVLAAARRSADALLAQLAPDGRLAGRYTADWRPAASWACLTGIAQIAHSWLLLYRACGEPAYLDAGRRANAYVRRTVKTSGPDDTRGGVKGSFPVDGAYGHYQYLNWAPKFLGDSLMEERAVAREIAAAT